MSNLEAVQRGVKEWKGRLPAALALVVLVTVAVYWPAFHNGFIDYDDTDYVTVNVVVRQGLSLKGLLWSLTAFHAGNWHPLTWLSHMLDVQLFDLNPAGHHAVNVLFHAANALLICLIFNRLTGRLGRSLLVALLFALHPLHVESVAWIAERKDVLSTFFWLLTMGAYLRYAERPSAGRYLTVLLSFILGLMAKQMLVTLPVVLLLLDYWPLKRLSLPIGKQDPASPGLKRLVAEKLPLLAIAAVAALATIFAQKSGKALSYGAGGSELLYAGNALICYVKYLANMVWPVDLALFYPLIASEVTAAKVAGAALLLAAVTALVVWQGRRRPYLAFGWFWYLVTMLPVIGFIKVGSQAMADRYTYVPLIGIFVLVVWGGAELAGRWRYGIEAAGAVAALLLAVCSALTVTQIGYWQNSYGLYTHALSAVPDNWLAHNNLAILEAQQYRYDEAIRHFSESLRINPNQAEGYRNLGTVYQSTGNNLQAINCFREAVRLSPGDVEGHFRLGYAYLAAGNPELAYQEYLELQRLDESHARPLLDSIRMVSRR
ncbi:MAG TPA: tetratricopeptide repeat protein [Geomonas sp.]|nr:tetratricopeptide repeat protein [Geomonas sp.]